jgi:uncharacterized OB-fold protein
MTCCQCGGFELEVVELSGYGYIKSFTSVFVAAEGRESELPYTLVMVKMEEGPYLLGTLGVLPTNEITMAIINHKVKLAHRLYKGDKYSAGEAASPHFILID